MVLERFTFGAETVEVSVGYTPETSEQDPYPTNPTITLKPGGNLKQALNAGHRKIRLEPGDYGNQLMGTLPSGAYVYCEDGLAEFDGGFRTEFFGTIPENTTLRGVSVVRYGQHITANGGSQVVIDGGALLNCEVGIAKMNCVRIQGDGSRMEDCRLYRAHRFGWHGSGDEATLKRNRVEDCGLNVDPEVGRASDENRGVCKVVLSSLWHVEKTTIRRCNNGIWFDIANEPAIILDTDTDDVRASAVFIEVSYGDSGYGGWLVDGVTSTRTSRELRGVEPSVFWPKPAVVSVSLTPDVTVLNVQTDGLEHCTVGFIEWNHSQLNNSENDRTRMGIDNELVENCTLKGHGVSAGFDGSASNSQIRRGDPVFRNNVYPTDGPFRWKSQNKNLAGWKALGHS
jgi:hypothetical protein